MDCVGGSVGVVKEVGAVQLTPESSITSRVRGGVLVSLSLEAFLAARNPRWPTEEPRLCG
jgi:hypothetical protein